MYGIGIVNISIVVTFVYEVFVFFDKLFCPAYFVQLQCQFCYVVEGELIQFVIISKDVEFQSTAINFK